MTDILFGFAYRTPLSGISGERTAIIRRDSLARTLKTTVPSIDGTRNGSGGRAEIGGTVDRPRGPHRTGGSRSLYTNENTAMKIAGKGTKQFGALDKSGFNQSFLILIKRQSGGTYTHRPLVVGLGQPAHVAEALALQNTLTSAEPSTF